MGSVVSFKGIHADALSLQGYKSGRRSLRETPVSLSIGSTNSAATPRLDRSSQYQTCDCVVPIRSASGFWPPAASHARLRASLDMKPQYPKLGELQPKTLWGTKYRYFGNLEPMNKDIDSSEFGRRVRELRKERKLSQGKLGKLSGDSQTNIGWIEAGNALDPKKQAIRLATALQSTTDWLLYGVGEKNAPLRVMTPEEFAKAYSEMPLSMQRAFTQMVEERREEMELDQRSSQKAG